MSRERMESCLKKGGLLCIAASCIDIRLLESRKSFEKIRWKGGEEGQKRKSKDVWGSACHPEAMWMRLETASW